MRHVKTAFMGACCALGVAVLPIMQAAAGTNEPLPQTAVVPHEAMRALDGLLGEWISVSQIANGDGTWTTLVKDRVEFRLKLRDLVVSERVIEHLEGTGTIIHTDFSYDQYREVYRLMAVDDTWGLMDIYEGDIMDGALQVTNLRSGTASKLDDGRDLHFRLTIPLSGDERLMTIDRSVDEGLSWVPFFRVTYVRSQD